MSNSRMYAIDYNPSEEAFSAGRIGDGRQVLIGILFPKLIVIFFNDQGTMTGRQIRNATSSAPPVGAPMQNYEAEMLSSLERWKVEIGFVPGAIRVKKFMADGVGITDHPEYHNDCLSNPSGSEDERLRNYQAIEKWRQEKMFVFWWAKDYWMNADGSINST